MNPVRNKKMTVSSNLRVVSISNGMKKLLLLSALFFSLTGTAQAQSWVGSPTTQYGTAVSQNQLTPAQQAAQQNTQSAQGGCRGGICTYVPLEPLSPYASLSGYKGVTGAPGQESYLATAFRLLLSLGGLFAVVMLVLAGISYMLSESPIKTGQAKERAIAALWGIGLLVSCWLILYVINPNLLRFNLSIGGQQIVSGGLGQPRVNVIITPTSEINRQTAECERNGRTVIGRNADNSVACN